MSLINLDQLLSPCSEDAPCGIDLEYHADYIMLMQAAEGSPEVQYGGMQQEALPPDWIDIIQQAQTLMGQSHDLRLALLLTRALLARHGLEGFEQGLALTARLLQQDWIQLYPRLDPDEDLDPTERTNILLELCNVNSTGILRLLRNVPVIDMPGLEPVGLHTLQLASLTKPPPSYDGPSLDHIVEASMNNDADTLQNTANQLGQCLSHAQTIEQCVGTQVDPQYDGINLSPLSQLLTVGLRFIEQQLPRHPQRQAAIKTMPAENGLDNTSNGQQNTLSILDAANRDDGEIHNGDDVARLLDKLCQYYARYEPSSPIPILLMRAQKLIKMNFMEIMQDLAPSGISEIQYLSGIRSMPTINTSEQAEQAPTEQYKDGSWREYAGN